MATLLETIREHSRSRSTPISAIEIEHFVLTTVAAALEMALNAVDNSVDWNPGTESVRDFVDPARLIDELKEDFTANVQQYWLAPIGNARTGPIDELGLTATQIERKT